MPITSPITSLASEAASPSPEEGSLDEVVNQQPESVSKPGDPQEGINSIIPPEDAVSVEPVPNVVVATSQPASLTPVESGDSITSLADDTEEGFIGGVEEEHASGK